MAIPWVVRRVAVLDDGVLAALEESTSDESPAFLVRATLGGTALDRVELVPAHHDFAVFEDEVYTLGWSPFERDGQALLQDCVDRQSLVTGARERLICLGDVLEVSEAEVDFVIEGGGTTPSEVTVTYANALSADDGLVAVVVNLADTGVVVLDEVSGAVHRITNEQKGLVVGGEALPWWGATPQPFLAPHSVFVERQPGAGLRLTTYDRAFQFSDGGNDAACAVVTTWHFDPATGKLELLASATQAAEDGTCLGSVSLGNVHALDGASSAGLARLDHREQVVSWLDDAGLTDPDGAMLRLVQPLLQLGFLSTYSSAWLRGSGPTR